MTAITRRKKALLTLIAAVLTVTALTLGLTANKADAATYWSTGAVGSAQLPRGVCKFHNAWGRLDASINAPTIYARDYRAGGGNDWAWVRYRVFVVDSRGQTVQASSYSSWAVAYDNQPAALSGATTFQNVPNGARLDIRVEWWNSTSMVGALAFRVGHYNHYSGMVGPLGPMDSCWKH